jgi:large subunit ribosomal protein L35
MGRKNSSSKTRKGVAKRFKVTATGKIKRQGQGRSHMFTGKSRKRKNRVAKGGFVAESHAAHITENVPFN